MWGGGEWTEIISTKRRMKPVKFATVAFCSHPVAVTFPPPFFLLQPLLPLPVLVPVPISSLYASLALPPTAPPLRTITGFSLLSLVLV